MLKTSQPLEYTWICDICGEVIEFKDLVRIKVEEPNIFNSYGLDVHRSCLPTLTMADILPKGVLPSK